MIAVGIIHSTASAEPSPATKPSTRPVDFVAALEKPYADMYLRRNAQSWTRLLRRARALDGKRFDLDARDRLLEDVGRIVGANPEAARNLRIAIVEVVDQNGHNPARYDRAALVSDSGRSPDALEPLTKMGLVKLPLEWFKLLEPPLLTALDEKGSNNGVKSASDAVEALVITYFDGSRWKTETWFWPVTGAYSAVEEGTAKRGQRDTLPESPRRLLAILDAVQPYGLDGEGFGPPAYRDLLKDFPMRKPATSVTGSHEH